MKNICMLRKYAAILVLSVCSMVSAFAQGAVIGYAFGQGWIGKSPSYPNYSSFPTNAQLQRLTHVIASDIGCRSVGSGYDGLWINQLPNKQSDWSNGSPGNVWKKANHSTNKNLWLDSLVNRAHRNGVQAILCIGGSVEEHAQWVTGTSGLYTNSSSNIYKFVSDIVSFVNLHGFDGVDIDWECPGLDLNWEPIAEPQRTTAWTQYIALLNALKSALPCKRISIALPAAVPDPYDTWLYPNLTIPQQIWAAVDAFHLMTYDVRSWASHSHASNSIWVINEWANWNKTQNLGLNIKKLFLACAFYGYKKDGSTNTTLWGDANKVDYATYSGGGSYNSGDMPGTGSGGSLKQKVDSCYNRKYGGVFAWELGYDKILSNGTPELLDAVWAANFAKGGYIPNIAITTQPAATTTVTQGSISGSLSVVTNKSCNYNGNTYDGAVYQWYKSSTNSNSSGTPEPGATNASFTIPTSLAANTYYYYCVVKSGRSTATSSVAKVIVNAAPPSAPSNLQYSSVTTNGCTLTWSASSGSPTGYRVYHNGTKIGNDLPSSPTSVTITTLSPSTSYILCVKAYNSAGESSCSNTVSFTTLTPPPPVITGSTPICSGSPKQFSASNWISGYSFSSSANLSLSGLSVSGTNASITVSAASSSISGLCYVYVKDSSGATLATYKVWVGVPTLYISGSDYVPVNEYMNYSAELAGFSGIYASSYQWSVSPYAYPFVYNYGDKASIQFGSNNTYYTVSAKASNSCGWGNWADLLVYAYNDYSPSNSIFYPNPASNKLTIDIDTAVKQTITDAKAIKTAPAYDVRLYDGQGNIVRQQSTKGGTVQFNVSALPDGIYYLHIYDGVNSTPEIQQIMVQH